MANYRISLTRENGSIVSGSDADCSSDLAACVHARLTMTGDEQAEVWRGTTLIGLVYAAPEQQTLRPYEVASPAHPGEVDSWHADFAW